jgi:putative membrane protein
MSNAPDERTYLAFDRTLLAWVRTSTSLLTFGFGIYRLLVQQATESGSHPILEFVSPRSIGLAMIAAGFIGLLMAVVEYVSFARSNGRSVRQTWFSPSLVVSYVVLLLCLMILTGAVVGG